MVVAWGNRFQALMTLGCRSVHMYFCMYVFVGTAVLCLGA